MLVHERFIVASANVVLSLCRDARPRDATSGHLFLNASQVALPLDLIASHPFLRVGPRSLDHSLHLPGTAGAGPDVLNPGSKSGTDDTTDDAGHHHVPPDRHRRSVSTELRLRSFDGRATLEF